jgi:hypothetical protein
MLLAFNLILQLDIDDNQRKPVGGIVNVIEWLPRVSTLSHQLNVTALLPPIEEAWRSMPTVTLGSIMSLTRCIFTCAYEQYHSGL